MKKFLTFFAVFVMTALGGKGLAQTPTSYSPTASSEVIYTTLDNLKNAAWAVDKDGGKAYSSRSGKVVSTNPETDADYASETKKDGINIKNNTATNRSIVFYITGISEFKAYAEGASGKELSIEYNVVIGDATTKVVTQTWTSGHSIVATVSNLDPSKTYKFWTYANSKDMMLYAIKLTKGTVTPPTPELTSYTPANQATDVLKGTDITLTYNVEVNAPTVTVTVNSTAVAADSVTTTDNKTFTVKNAVTGYNTTYTVNVAATTTADADASSVAGAEWSFTTAPFTAPTATVTPADGAKNVAVGTPIVIAYSDALAEAPAVTVNSAAATVTASADMRTFTVEGVVTEYGKTYTVVAAAAPAKEDNTVSSEAKTWSFTTEQQTVEATLKPTTATILWDTPSYTGSSVMNESLALVDVNAVDLTKKHFTLKKIDNHTETPGYMVFKIPAGATGNLVISADGNNKTIRVHTATTVQTLEDLKGVLNNGTLMGNTTDGVVKIFAKEFKADPSSQTYVYVYNTGGQVNYHAVMWSLESTYVTSINPTRNATDVAVGSDVVVTYNAAVNLPTITINGVEATATASADNRTFTVAGAAAKENKSYAVVVGETTAQADGSKVLSKAWSFTTGTSAVIDPTEKKYVECCGVQVELPAEGKTIDVALPYYTTFNYQDSAQVVDNTKGVNCTVTDLKPATENFEFDYSLKVDGTAYTMHLARQAFRTSGALTVNGATAGALYLMPTQSVVAGNEPTAITIIADSEDVRDGMTDNSKDAFLTDAPRLTGNIVYYDGKTKAVIKPTIVWDSADKAVVHKQYGYKTSKVYGTFTHDSMNVRVALIRNLVPPEDELRICTFEDIDLEQYLPSGNGADGKLNSITIRGVKVYASDADPKTPVRVTHFDVNNPERSLTVGSYGPFYHSLKLGGKAKLGKDGTMNDPVARYVAVPTQADQVIMALALNGSNTHQSKFRIKGPKAESRERLLPKGGTGWWGHKAQQGGLAKFYGYDSGTNGTNGANGGNVAYCFISAGPGKQYLNEDELGVEFNPHMSTVKVGTDDRALTTSNQLIKLVVKISKVDFQSAVADNSVTSFRTSHLSFRKICSINALNETDYPNVKDASMAVQDISLSTSYGSEDKLSYENMFTANLISQETKSITEDGKEKWEVALVIEPQKKLEANSYYELWGNHGMFLVADEAAPGDRLLSYAMPLYRIFTADEMSFGYDFEDAKDTSDDRISPSNVYVESPTAGVSVVKLNAVTGDVTGPEDNSCGTSVLGVIDEESTSLHVGFDTPKEFPGTQDAIATDSYRYITFSVFIPQANIVARAVPSVSLTAADGTLIPLVDQTQEYVYDGSRKADVPVAKLDAQEIGGGVWISAMAASAVASSAFPAFPQTNRIYMNIEGANKAYIDNLDFSTADVIPTAVAEIGKDKAAYFDGCQVVAPAECGVEVYDMTGRLVLTGKGCLDLSRLNSGIYIVRCGDDVLKIAK